MEPFKACDDRLSELLTLHRIIGSEEAWGGFSYEHAHKQNLLPLHMENEKVTFLSQMALACDIVVLSCKYSTECKASHSLILQFPRASFTLNALSQTGTVLITDLQYVHSQIVSK